MTVKLAEIWRYPVKGLAGERLSEVHVGMGQVLPLDRHYALAHGDSGIEPSAPQWALKTSFHMLMHGGDERLAELTPRFDSVSGQLGIMRAGQTLVEAKPDDAAGQAALSDFFARYLENRRTGSPRFMAANGFYFGNVEDRVISLINLASVDDLARTAGQNVDKRRFRGNFYIQGLTAWAERAWVGKMLIIGAARFSVVDETIRCGATRVNPANAARDLNVPRILQKAYGHMFCGVYLKALNNATISEGAPVSLSNGVAR
jgi:hypothetical protein